VYSTLFTKDSGLNPLTGPGLLSTSSRIAPRAKLWLLAIWCDVSIRSASCLLLTITKKMRTATHVNKSANRKESLESSLVLLSMLGLESAMLCGAFADIAKFNSQWPPSKPLGQAHPACLTRAKPQSNNISKHNRQEVKK